MAPRVAPRRDSPTPALSPFPPRGPVLVVSPHLDDAALSCAALLDRGEPLDVLTVFTWVPEHALRSDWDRLDSDREAIIAAVREWMEGIETGLVALPAGAGQRGRWRFKLDRMIGRSAAGRLQHPDHVFVRDAALDALCGGSSCDLLLYEEAPYSFSRTADSAVASVESGIGAQAVARSVEVDRRRKADRIAAYRSQLPHLCPNGLRLDLPDSLPQSSGTGI